MIIMIIIIIIIINKNHNNKSQWILQLLNSVVGLYAIGKD